MTVPSRPKPVWGNTEYPLQSGERESFFTSDDISELAQTYGIEGEELLAKVTKHLEVSAQVYWGHKLKWDDIPRMSQIKAAVLEIGALVNDLHWRMENMNEVTGNWFWQPENEVHLLAFHPIKKATESRFGHKITRDQIGPDTEVVHYLERDDHLESLTILKNYCRDALERIPDDKGGRSTSYGFRLWIINMKALWEKILGRRFTQSFHNGEPISDASRFCVDATKPVDPEITSTAIQGMMRKVISKERAKAKKAKTPS
jgi:hypothetical protein